MPSPLKGKKRSNGVCRKVRKQLAKDIFKAGGIQNFDKNKDQALREILNREDRKEVYAPYKRNAHSRIAIQNLVNRWKGWDNEKYLELVHIPLVLEADNAVCPDTSDDEEDISDEEEINSKPPQPPQSAPKKRAIPLRTQKISTKSQTTMANELGKKIVGTLPKGIILCIIWVDTKLSNLDFYFGDDGYSVKMKTRIPNPADASELLGHYGAWSSDKQNVAVSTLDDILLAIKGDKPTDRWEETEIVTAEEELVKAFVDNRGKPLEKKNIGHRTDKEGRQYITFFLKTLRAQQSQHTAARSCFGGSHNPGPNGMDIGEEGEEGEDGDELHDESIYEDVEGIKADMDDRFSDMSNRMQQSQAQMQQQLASMMNMMNSMNNFMTQAQQEHEQQQQQQQNMFHLPTGEVGGFSFENTNPKPDGMGSL